MLKRVELSSRDIKEYQDYMSGALFGEIKALRAKLSGKRILNISSTEKGGGVAEILMSKIPIERSLGLAVDWMVLEAPPEFFAITKKIHNGLQGDSKNLSAQEWSAYEEYNARLAKHIDSTKWDFIVIHDPQPAAVLSFMQSKGKAKWIWRCHIDTHHANPNYVKCFLDYLAPYDGCIYSLDTYVLAAQSPRHLAVIPMAIDPLSPKNMNLTLVEAKNIVQGFGINTSKPLVVQVSRFDPWKDPLGVIAAWKLAKKQVPNLQLALVGNTADDDPESQLILSQVLDVAREQPDVFVIADAARDRDVRAFQTAADVVVQKSLREGFGLTVTEAMWAGTPVIGGDVGGIKLQIKNGQDGYTASSISETAERIVELVRDPELAAKMGECGHEHVGEKFLMPRLVRDELSFLLEVGQMRA